MGLLGWLIAGAAIATVVSNKKKKNNSTSISNVVVKSDSNYDNVNDFLQAYNSLEKTCAYYFGKDEYNSIKKLAMAIKFSVPKSHNNEVQHIVDALYDIVTIRNKFICHNMFGIGAIPCRKYIELMNLLNETVKNSPQQFIDGYKRFIIIKKRKLLK